MKTSAIINSLDGSFKPYFAADVTQARDTCDASAFKSAIEHQQAIAMGKTIVRPLSSGQARILETLLAHVRVTYKNRHVRKYRWDTALDEIRLYIKDFRRYAEAYA